MPRTRSQPVTSQRPRGFSFRAAASVLTFGVTVCAIAGPTFEEIPDAGSSPSSAQPASGTGPLGRIKGDLTGTADAIDFEDMYLICITDPVGFSATVDATGTNFDTQLWLFHLDGTGLLSNDNDEPSFPTVFSKITPLSTDGSGAALTTPGLYFLAISVKGSFPVSPAGPIFNDPTPNGIEVSGPDGPGGLLPIQAWLQDGAERGGAYAIDLTGVKFFEPSCSTVCPQGAAIDFDAFNCEPFNFDPNGGCTMPGNQLQNLGPIVPGMYRAACGTTGVEFDGADPVHKDSDWYRIPVAAPGYLVASLIIKGPDGDPLVNAHITLLQGGLCANQIALATATGFACPLSIGPIPVMPGQHVVVVTFDDPLPLGPPCPTPYTLWIDERPTLFPGCGDPTSGPCNAPHPGPACNDTFCCDLVCASDPFCCEEQWDGICANAAQTMCASTTCEGDLNSDNVVNGMDLAILLGAWGSGKAVGDLNGDGIVNGADLAILLGSWGKCGK